MGIKIVLAHDSFTQLGGAERVVLGMAEIFPEAPIYVLVADPKIVAQLPEHVQWFTPSGSPLQKGRERAREPRIKTTKLQWLYRIYPKFQHLLPFIPFVLWFTRLPECDVLLSSSSAFAKGFRKPRRPQLSLEVISSSYSSPREERLGEVVENKNNSGGIVNASSVTMTSPNPSSRGGEKERVSPRGGEQDIHDNHRAIHINYCHTPTRFLWTDSEYVVQEVPWIVRLPARLFLWWMKQWDLRAARNVDVFLANSTEVQERIQKYYHRTSEVVYPFVDTEFWMPGQHSQQSFRHPEPASDEGSALPAEEILRSQGLPQNDRVGSGGYFLIAGRLHAHKHNDLVVAACTELELPLHVVGSGRDEVHLKSIAGPTVTFLGRVTDEKLREEFAGARAYIYPQLEDFGLMPVEAASCGTPTIGIDAGGSRETIVPGVTGEWFHKGNKDELKKLLEHFDESKYSVEALRKHAEQFSKQQFVERINAVIHNISM